MPEPRTIDDLTTEELREWIADWTLWHYSPSMFEAWRGADNVAVQNMIGQGDDWWVLRDELLSAYAERAK